eukprot:3166848-Pleurochrysis_carterae.AAC.1
MPVDGGGACAVGGGGASAAGGSGGGGAAAGAACDSAEAMAESGLVEGSGGPAPSDWLALWSQIPLVSNLLQTMLVIVKGIGLNLVCMLGSMLRSCLGMVGART